MIRFNAQKRYLIHFSLLFLLSFLAGEASASGFVYQVGSGMTNITCSPAEVQLGGYSDSDQIAEGVFMRQFARTFIVKDKRTDKSIVLVVADIPMMSTGVYVEVIKKLKVKFGEKYTEKNVTMSATHTHSGAGGYFKTYALNLLVGGTFHQDNYDTIIKGIFDSIVMAHNNLKDGKLYLNSGEFSYEKHKRISRNRSHEAYQLNRDANQYLLPNGEKDDTNRTLSQLNFLVDSKSIGIYNWLPNHPNIGGPKLKLVGPDVNGFASYLCEEQSGANYQKLYENKPEFVAAFAQTFCGDTSGNLPEDSYKFDDVRNRNLDDKNDDYIADGRHDYARMKMRAEKIKELAETVSKQGEELTGNIEFRQMFIPVENFPIRPEFISVEDIYYEQELGESLDNCKTCSMSLGYGMLTGSTEDYIFNQDLKDEGLARANILDYSLPDLTEEPIPALTGILSNILLTENELKAEIDCQLEKRVLAPLWSFNRVIPGKVWNMNQPVQILKIGKLAILTLPFEMSVMSGRRFQKEIKKVMPEIEKVVINATSNSDLRYLTTREEYAVQHYEGAENFLGPYTLNACLQFVHQLAESFTEGIEIPDYAVDIDTVEDGLEKISLFQIKGKVVMDTAPLFKKFGDVITQPSKSYSISELLSKKRDDVPTDLNGDEESRIRAVFQGAHPNNNLTVKSHDSYLYVEKKEGDKWVTVAYDWNPSTRMRWKRKGVASSYITIDFYVNSETEPGEYRIRHKGYKKMFSIKSYEGTTRSFTLTP
ncbi:MAG: neutral/alkaline ceramidase [Desulfobacterales bacterium]|nr:neutral/alkaline ceramidase [Desulfobacterales bacterium]